MANAEPSPAPEVAPPPRPTEAEKVHDWQQEHFEALGCYNAHQIFQLLEQRVDYHALEKLLAAGCPPEVAFRILM